MLLEANKGRMMWEICSHLLLSCLSLPPPLQPLPTTVLLIAVVPAVIETIAHSPQQDAAVVCFTVEFRIVVTAVGRAH